MATGTGVKISWSVSEQSGRAGCGTKPSRGDSFWDIAGSEGTVTGGVGTATEDSDRACRTGVLAAGGAVQVGHSRMAGEHSCPHSGQIQYSIYIHSRTKVLLHLSATNPSLF